MAKDLIIYGIHPLLEAIESGKEIDKVLIQNGLRIEHLRDLTRLLSEQKVPFQYVPIQKLNRITTKNHQGIIGFISPVVYENIENLLPSLFEQGESPFFLVLDRITDVRNFGALARTAECAGIHAIILPSRGSAQINEDAMKTSSGALMRIPICRSENLKNTLNFLINSGIQLIGITEKAEKFIYSGDYTLPTALILGSEEDGISDAYLKLCNQRLKIPLVGSIESLNVSVAGGIAMFEVLRQRQEDGQQQK